MSVRVSCPYCNHAVRLGGPPAGGRVTCPRCGDTFPYRPPADRDARDDRDEPASHDAAAAAAAAVLAVVLRRPPEDEEQFLHALKAKRDPSGTKDRYTVAAAGFPLLRLDLVRVSGREWVVGLGDHSLRRAAADTERGSGHLS